ncbi:MAG: ribonuclease R [Olsenella sp.]|nr:ribonuclease R [Olsenella sp.]
MGKKHARGGGHRRGPHANTRKPLPVLTGTIRIHRPGVADITTAEGTFPVARGGIREAMDGDEVRATVLSRNGARVAFVQTVLERATSSFVGTFEWAEPLGVVVPLDGRMRRDFFVVPDDQSPKELGVSDGDVVVARILEYPTRHGAGIVTIESRRGSADELDLNVESVIASLGLATAFPEAAIAQAEGMSEDVGDALLGDPLRRDMRSSCAVTVDPTDARDFDDAVAARRLDDGFELEVHIADVSHYVAWDTPIDNEAKRRACSVYLVDRVLPMLPERLSNDLCSLRPGEDRLTMSVVMRLDAAGEVRSAEAFPAVIRSRARLDYDTVDRLLSGAVEPCDLSCEEGPRDRVAESLRVLDEIAGLRRAVRMRRGAIDFETKETKVLLDESGSPTGVLVRERTRATSLIEEAMLVANETVAALLAQADAPAAFRVHERPSPDDLAETLPILREQGVAGGGRADAIVAGDPFAIRAALSDARGQTGEFLVNSVLLRAQKRAVYLPHNEGHYALGAKAYCHFTSPIRRYPDLIVHRALRAQLEGRAHGREQGAIAKALPQLCRTSSEMERLAERASRETQKVKMAELYQSRIGESFSGIVVDCERYGLFVMLDDTYAEGLLPVRELGDEWFYFDEKRFCLTGEESGKTWRPGKRVAVTVVGASPARGQIDFALAGKA